MTSSCYQNAQLFQCPIISKEIVRSILRKNDTEQPKPARWQSPSVVLSPSFAGMVVVETKNGAESLVGQTFPWYRVNLDGVSGDHFVQLCDEHSKQLKLNGKAVSGSFTGKRKMVLRLRDRAARKWTNESRDSIFYRPIGSNQHTWRLFFLSMLIGAAIVSYSAFTMLVPSLQQPLNMPTRLVLITAFALIQLFAVGVPVFFWKNRPRCQDFVSLDFSPTGVVGTTAMGEFITLVFAELKSKKLIKSNPMQCRLETPNGQVYWIILRRPMNVFVIRALYPGSDSRKDVVAATVRHLNRLGVSLIAIGFVLSLLGNMVAHYLANTSAILPEDVRRIRVGLVYVPLMSSFFGLQLCCVAWKHSTRGQRTVKAVKSRFSKPKDSPKNTTP